MPKYSDESPEAAQAALRQAARLRLLRRLLVHSQLEAARLAGVTRDAWNRMEIGEHRISALALARFGKAFGLPMEYVLSGRTDGLPQPLVERLILARPEAEIAAGISLTEPDPADPPRAPEPDLKPWGNPVRKCLQAVYS